MSSGRDVVCATSQLFLREGTVRTFLLRQRSYMIGFLFST